MLAQRLLLGSGQLGSLASRLPCCEPLGALLQAFHGFGTHLHHLCFKMLKSYELPALSLANKLLASGRRGFGCRFSCDASSHLMHIPQAPLGLAHSLAISCKASSSSNQLCLQLSHHVHHSACPDLIVAWSIQTSLSRRSGRPPSPPGSLGKERRQLRLNVLQDLPLHVISPQSLSTKRGLRCFFAMKCLQLRPQLCSGLLSTLRLFGSLSPCLLQTNLQGNLHVGISRCLAAASCKCGRAPVALPDAQHVLDGPRRLLAGQLGKQLRLSRLGRLALRSLSVQLLLYLRWCRHPQRCRGCGHELSSPARRKRRCAG
mmetsp:Transcript_21040/g.36522  ORF Transcript_21040/g.36522 Transcript_21040/m.36522 type:complete len:316 (+) Transcript_21040:689-1636(+)